MASSSRSFFPWSGPFGPSLLPPLGRLPLPGHPRPLRTSEDSSRPVSSGEKGRYTPRSPHAVDQSGRARKHERLCDCVRRSLAISDDESQVLTASRDSSLGANACATCSSVQCLLECVLPIALLFYRLALLPVAVSRAKPTGVNPRSKTHNVHSKARPVMDTPRSSIRRFT
ncbi:hypothetical protein KC322_g93 [Hortaea werneckii]|nr:hypothetical protein KC322_g93 [Hortaea werneckii]